MVNQVIKNRTLPKYSHIFAIVLISTMLLTACRNASPPANESGKATSTVSESAEPQSTKTPRTTSRPKFTPTPTSSLGLKSKDLEDVAIEFWHPWSGPLGETVEELVDAFNKSNQWGISVDTRYVDNYDQMFGQVSAALEQAAQGQGDTPDVVTAYHYQALAWDPGLDALVDLSDYVEDPQWGLSEDDQTDFYPVFWEHDLHDGQRLGIPALRSGQLLYYNLSWAEELGFESPPTSPFQFKQQACAAASANLIDEDPSNDNTGGWIISTDYSAMLGWLRAFGSEIESPGGDGYQFDTPQVEDTLTFLRGLYDEGCAWLSESQNSEGEFASRLGLFSIGSVSGIPHQEAAFADLGSRDKWTVIPFPSANGEPIVDIYGPSFQVFTSTPEEQLAGWLLVKALTSPENQAKLAQSSAFYPVRMSSLDYMGNLPARYPQWEAAVDFLVHAKSEPPYQSWRIVRWAVSDAATQLYRYYFSIEQVPNLVELLDRTADDLHGEN
jgi:ABC-type glycerol-3-phosphate transport system substrate-binding protein